MKLTIWYRLKLCWEVLTIRSGHAHPPQEKGLPSFMRGYDSGLKDGRHETVSKYDELIMAVERKFKDESRHETALKYIQEAENRKCGTANANKQVEIVLPHTIKIF